jgi:hypothetical protein
LATISVSFWRGGSCMAASAFDVPSILPETVRSVQLPGPGPNSAGLGPSSPLKKGDRHLAAPFFLGFHAGPLGASPLLQRAASACRGIGPSRATRGRPPARRHSGSAIAQLSEKASPAEGIRHRRPLPRCAGDVTSGVGSSPRGAPARLRPAGVGR